MLFSSRATLRHQLSFTFMAGVLCLAVISSLTTSYLASGRLRESLLMDGAQMAENFAARTGNRLALLYGTPDNANDEANITVAFPDVMSVKLYTYDKVDLLSRSKGNIPEWKPDPAAPWPSTGVKLQHETAELLYFMAPVYAVRRDQAETPFAEIPTQELLGYALVAIGKMRLGENQTRIFLDNVVVSLALAAVLLLLLQILIARVTAPLGALSDAMQRAGAGVAGLRAKPAGPADIFEMAQVFNQMMQTLEERDRILRQKNEILELEVAQRESVQRQLSASQERFELAVRGSSDGIWDWDIQTNQVYFSPPWKQQLGYHDDEFPNLFEEWENRLHPEDHQRALDILKAYVAGSMPDFALEHRLRHKDGHYRWILSRAMIVRDAAGRPIRMAGSHTDITARMRMEDDLRAARDAALEAARLKAAFLANMSHELRTPLNGVLGMLDLLRASPLGVEQREYAEIAYRSGDVLLTLINDVLDFSKIESGRMKLEQTPFDVRQLLEEALEAIALRTTAKGVELSALIAPNLPHTVNGDPTRLRQILINLLGNAEKFTSHGEIFVSATYVEDHDGQLRLRCDVVDTGIGIAPEAQARLFKSFVQADDSTTRRFGGTGLGLAIVKGLVEAMGGEIGLRSEPGRGSLFWFTVCLQRVAAEAVDISDARLRGRRALIVSSNANQRMVMQHLLTDFNMHHDQALDTAEMSVKLCAASGRAEKYAVVLLDLPTVGENILQQIASSGARLLVLVPFGQSRFAMPGVHTVSKPLRRHSLHAAILRSLDCAMSSSMHANAARRPALPRHRILVVEDNKINQQVIVSMLKSLAQNVDVAENGHLAVEALERASYHLVFMDCQMPVMDGYQATRRIREKEQQGWRAATAPRLPIIALTADATKEVVNRCLADGMDDHLAKPVTTDAVRKKLVRWLKLEGEVQPPPESGAMQATLALPVAKRPPAVDENKLSELTHIMGAKMGEFISAFLEDLSAHLGKITAALSDHRFEEARKIAHTLKGSSANVGASTLAGLLVEIEAGCRTAAADAARRALTVVEQEAARVSEELTHFKRALIQDYA